MTQQPIAKRLNKTRRDNRRGAPQHETHDADTDTMQTPGGMMEAAIKIIAESAAESATANSKQLQAQLDEFRADMTAKIDEVKRPIINAIHIPGMPELKMTGKQHHKFSTILRTAAATKGNGGIMLVGPAGSGKTTLAKQIADALQLPFAYTGRCESEFAVKGFIDAHGNYQPTPFRRAYENGGVFCLDEVDASTPEALVAINGALGNKQGDFPDGIVEKHDDFIFVATANTYGRGATTQYIGRNQLDAATLDRFVVFDIDYDQEIERALAPDGEIYDEWHTLVNAARDAAETNHLQIIISPRATQLGAAMIAAGIDTSEVIAATIIKGANDSEKPTITDAISEHAKNIANMETPKTPGADGDDDEE